MDVVDQSAAAVRKNRDHPATGVIAKRAAVRRKIHLHLKCKKGRLMFSRNKIKSWRPLEGMQQILRIF